VVIDQFGRALRGVEVQFQATNGSIAQERLVSVVTNADGYARGGEWVLRDTEGEDMVIATVYGLEPVRFQATARHAVELARYEFQRWTQSVGSLTFHTDQTLIYRWTTRHDDGTSHSGAIPGFYTRKDRSVSSTGGPLDPFVATITGNRLEVVWLDWGAETYAKTSAVPPWPE
jgi:hypothetical protein